MSKPSSNQKPPHTLISKETVFENRWTILEEHSVSQGDGKTHSYLINKDKQDAVGIIALTPENKIVLIKEYKYQAGDFIWTIPIGAVENNEVIASAERELAEEAGYLSNKIERLQTIHQGHNRFSQIHLTVAHKCKSAKEQELDSSEHIVSVTEKTTAEVVKMISSNEIKSGLVLACLCIYLASENLRHI